MSEKNNINEFDLMMKSILEEGQEEVPARIWDGVSEGLDKAARRKTVVLWFRRAAAGVAAAAAVVAGVFFNSGNDEILVPEAVNSDMIAVVEQVAIPEETETVSDHVYVAMARQERRENIAEDKSLSEVPITSYDAVKEEESHVTEVPEAEVSKREVTEKGKVGEKDYFPEDWIYEDEVKREKRGVSIVVSGITGTNNSENQNRVNPMKRPSVNPMPKKTGIEETSTRGSYGIPVSFGAGVKVDLSDRWSIGTGLNYTILSRQFYGKYTQINANGGIDNSLSSDIRNVQQYIGIPVNAFYDMISNERISLYAYAGGSVEKCVSDRYSILGTSIVHKEKADGVQLSANAGIGVEFMLGKHIGMYIDPSIRYYFDNGQPKSIRTTQPLMMGFEMGFRARL